MLMPAGVCVCATLEEVNMMNVSGCCDEHVLIRPRHRNHFKRQIHILFLNLCKQTESVFSNKACFILKIIRGETDDDKHYCEESINTDD